MSGTGGDETGGICAILILSVWLVPASVAPTPVRWVVTILCVVIGLWAMSAENRLQDKKSGADE